MTNVSIRAGGMPVPSDVLVSTDGTTIEGNGSALNPLRVANSFPSSQFERVSATNVQHGTLDPTIPLSIFGTLGNGLKQADLADGEVDGFQKTIAVNPNSSIGATMTINGNFRDDTGVPNTRVNFAGIGGGLILIWDSTNEWWIIVANNGGTPAA